MKKAFKIKLISIIILIIAISIFGAIKVLGNSYVITITGGKPQNPEYDSNNPTDNVAIKYRFKDNKIYEVSEKVDEVSKEVYEVSKEVDEITLCIDTMFENENLFCREKSKLFEKNWNNYIIKTDSKNKVYHEVTDTLLSYIFNIK